MKLCEFKMIAKKITNGFKWHAMHCDGERARERGGKREGKIKMTWALPKAQPCAMSRVHRYAGALRVLILAQGQRSSRLKHN